MTANPVSSAYRNFPSLQFFTPAYDPFPVLSGVILHNVGLSQLPKRATLWQLRNTPGIQSLCCCFLTFPLTKPKLLTLAQEGSLLQGLPELIHFNISMPSSFSESWILLCSPSTFNIPFHPKAFALDLQLPSIF